MTLTFEGLAQLRRPLVYVWSRGATVLYVGSSGNGVEQQRRQARDARIAALLREALQLAEEKQK